MPSSSRFTVIRKFLIASDIFPQDKAAIFLFSSICNFDSLKRGTYCKGRKYLLVWNCLKKILKDYLVRGCSLIHFPSVATIIISFQSLDWILQVLNLLPQWCNTNTESWKKEREIRHKRSIALHSINSVLTSKYFIWLVGVHLLLHQFDRFVSYSNLTF